MSFPSYERISDYVAFRHYWMMCTRADWELGIRNAEWSNDKRGYTLYTRHYTTGHEWGLHSTCQKSGELIHTFLNLSSLWALMSAACDETTPPLPFITFCHHPGPGHQGIRVLTVIRPLASKCCRRNITNFSGNSWAIHWDDDHWLQSWQPLSLRRRTSGPRSQSGLINTCPPDLPLENDSNLRSRWHKLKTNGTFL